MNPSERVTDFDQKKQRGMETKVFHTLQVLLKENSIKNSNLSMFRGT